MYNKLSSEERALIHKEVSAEQVATRTKIWSLVWFAVILFGMIVLGWLIVWLIGR